MITWILIMTIQTNMGLNSAVASVGTVGGFANETSCFYAGTFWQEMANFRSFICVPTDIRKGVGK